MTKPGRCYFLMVVHPSGKNIRVGPQYPTRKAAQGWRSFVSKAWRGCHVYIDRFDFLIVDGQLDAESIRKLDVDYNLDPPTPVYVQPVTTLNPR